jgi:hypothetical protein
MFEGEYGAVRLANEKLAARLGFNVGSLDEWRAVVAAAAEAPSVDTLMVPAPGIVVEPYLGQCAGGDEFVSGHRTIDLERATAECDKVIAEVAFAQAEASRLAQRLSAGDLSDPRPLAGVTAIEVEGLLPTAATTQPPTVPGGGS